MAGFQLSQTQNQTLRQEQQMAPQQIQALEILLATIPELEQKVSEELQENPTLELLDNGSEQLVGNPVEGDESGAADDEAAGIAAHDEALATLIQLTDSWRDYGPSYTGGGTNPDDLERRQFMFDSLVVEQTLQDLMQDQLRQVDGLDEVARKICLQIIGSIDETGYLRSHPADLAVTCGAPLDEILRCLRIVQQFDPPGIGARDLRECLLLQLERNGEKDSLAYRLVAKHPDDISRNQIPKIARAMRISTGQVYELLERIRRLSPYPGSLVTDSTADFVAPEVYIEKNEEGEWEVRANREHRPRLRVAPYYRKLLEDPDVETEAKRYIREKIRKSEMFLSAIENREATIVRIARSILKFQTDFFENGAEHMRPLVMNRVAEEIGVHETTVSRAIANKYVQTPHGLFSFKHFFTTGYRGEDGEQVSSLGIKEKLRAIIDSEDTRKPLSDQKLVVMLKEQGFDVARRTVAKYREEMGISPSHLRRSY